MKARGFFMILTLIALGLAVAAVSAGCGGSTSGTGTGTGVAETSAPDPCALITKSDMEKIMGEPVSDAQVQQVNAQNARSCSYTSVADPPRVASLTIYQPCSMLDYSNLAQGDMVMGVGMHAAWNKSMLVVHTEENACLIVSGGGNPRGADMSNDMPALANAKTIANMMIGKMGGEATDVDTSTGEGSTTGGTSTGMNSGGGM